MDGQTYSCGKKIQSLVFIMNKFANNNCHQIGMVEVKMVEVKGPRDRLSDQQGVVIDILQNCGFSIEVFNPLFVPYSL